MVLPLGAGLPGPTLNKFGVTGDGTGSLPVKLNVWLTPPVPVLVVKAAGVALFEFVPKVLLALKYCVSDDEALLPP